MSVQINLESYAKPWRPGIYPKSTTVIYNNQLWILNDTITGLFSSSDFLAEVANGDWIGRYTTEDDLSTKEDLSNKATDFTVINDTLYPSVEAVKEQLDLKLDKSTTPSSVYTTDAAGLQVMKPISEFKDVLEFTNLASFPVTGETGKIYLALDTNKTYRWSGSAYVQIGGSTLRKQSYCLIRDWSTPTLDRFYYVSYNNLAIEFRPVGTNNTIIDSLTGRNVGVFTAPYDCVITGWQVEMRNTGSFTGIFGIGSGQIVSSLALPMTNPIVHLSQAITSSGYVTNQYSGTISGGSTILKGETVCVGFMFSAQASATKGGVTIQLHIEEV